MTQRSLSATHLSLAYDKRTVVDSIDLQIEAGSVTVIVGANASGKSTVLRGLSRLMKPQAGTVLLDGADIRSIPSKQLARELGLLPQQPTAPGGITVAELVGRGRYPHQGWYHQPTADDDAAVVRALEATSTTELADRPVDELSGGQRQRVWIAMALAQDTDILLLDEPTTFLDVTHQIEVLDVLCELNRTKKTTVVMVLHDLNLAARYAHRLIVVADGRILTEGSPADVVTREVVAEAFGLDATITADPVTGAPMVIPHGRFHSPQS